MITIKIMSKKEILMADVRSKPKFCHSGPVHQLFGGLSRNPGTSYIELDSRIRENDMDAMTQPLLR
jgi:hypothetical protein